MKKLFSFIISVVLMISVVALFPIHGVAHESGIVLPEFTYPVASYETFKETGIPYDDILACFPENLEIQYENGAVYVKDLGGDNAYYTDRLNYDGYDGELVDGYWKFEASHEAYNSGGDISMYTDSHSWHAQYDISGKRGVLSLTTHYGRHSRTVSLYPTDGYGEQYVQVTYDLYSGLHVSDYYEAGLLVGQIVEIQNNKEAFWARYDAQGNLKYIDVSIFDTDEDASFIPGMGWSEHSWEYIPTEAPSGYENATLESLLAYGPTDIGCDHQWSEPLCDYPSICSLCKREKGEPIGHKWVSGAEYDTCSTCNGILYHAPKIDMPSFEKRPYLNLDQAGIKVDFITSKCIQKISTKYENGYLMVPNIDGYYFNVRHSSDGYVDYQTVNGWNLVKVAEEDMDDLVIRFSGGEDFGEYYYDFDFVYKHDGTLVSFDLYEDEFGKSIFATLEKNIVEVSYPKDKESKNEYIDVYVNANLSGQTVYDVDKRVKVYYDSDLKVYKVRDFVEGKYLYYVPEKGWYADEECKEAIDTPEGCENKNAAYFAQMYPHCIDFCLHSWELIDGGKECIKCGEKIVSSPAGLIIGTAAGVIIVVAVTVIVIKKKKS